MRASLRLFLGAALIGFCVAACTVKTDPDKGRFSCATSDDCGLGWECHPQVAGGGLCFKKGECSEPDRCDGKDNNCNGAIDDLFPEAGNPCETGAPGACATGITVCSAGTLTCTQNIMPAAEVCNGLDDNCDGLTDEAFDFTSDSSNCGSCGHACGAGLGCVQRLCKETNCGDNVDNDLNGKTDCADDTCLGRACNGSVMPAWTCAVVQAPDAGRVDAGTDGGFPDAGADDAGIDAGEVDAGDVDAGVSDAGSPPPLPPPLPDGGNTYGRGCYPPESNCGNGFDDDGDGKVDCADVDCNTLSCGPSKTCVSQHCQ